MSKDLYGIGQAAEQEAAKYLSSLSYEVLPMSAYNNNIGKITNAPMMYSGGELIPSPDLLILGGREDFFVEIKTKSEPTFYHKHGVYQHGIDYTNAMAYKKAQDNSGRKIYILILEENSPIDENLQVDWKEDASVSRRLKANLKPSHKWLCITLNDAFKHGEVRENNPKMKRPGNPDGKGLYWDRSLMKEIDIPERFRK